MVGVIRSIAIFVFCLILSGCAINPVTGKSQLMLITEEQEVTMGKKAAPALNWSFDGEYHDGELREYLGKIVNRIWNVSERPKLPFSFHIQNTSIPNAFALPGYVAITRGLLVELDNEAQFAAIMGHETGHVMARHSASRISRQMLQSVGLGVGGALLGDAEGADALLALGSVGSSLLLLKYDRSQELESDRLGVAYAARLGYDPYEAITAHQKLEDAVNRYLERSGKSSRSGGFLNEIVSTHPRKEVRLEEIRKMIVSLPPYQLQSDGKFAEDFLRMTRGTKKVHDAYVVFDDAERAFEKKDYERADMLVLKAIDMNDRQAPFYSLRGRIKFSKNRYDEAIALFSEALDHDTSYQPALYGIGVSEFKKNRYHTALEYIEKSLGLYPDHPGSLYVAGLCYHELNRPQDAIAHFGTFARMVQQHPEVYGYMGMNYEKIEKRDLAIDAYSAQVRISPRNSMGRYAKKRLSILKNRSTQ